MEYSANVDVKPLLFHYRIEAVDSNSQSNEHVDSDRSNLGDSVPVDTTHSASDTSPTSMARNSTLASKVRLALAGNMSSTFQV